MIDKNKRHQLLPQGGSLRSNTAVAISVGTLFSALWILLTWRYGFDMADEGYYWYGARRMLHGDMPMRDFMAYDIGRYAWTAGIMRLVGDSGIVGARIGAALYQICTIVAGLMLVLQATAGKFSERGKILFACVVALVLNLWVYPYYKVFDYGTSILIVAMLVLMLNSRAVKSWFGAGLILGLAAIVGRNHGVYGAFSAFLLFCFLLAKGEAPKGLLRPACAFIAGTILGFSPTFLLCALIDGFAAGLIASIIDLIDSGATNIRLPVPWPWLYDKAEMGWVLWMIGVSKGLGFIAIVAVPLMAILAMARRPLARFRQTDVLTLCAAFTGLGYAHYAYSRADLTHLALSIAPLLLMALSVGAAHISAILTSIAVLGLSVLALTPEKTYLAQLILKKPLSTISVNGTELHVFPDIKTSLDEVEQALAQHPEARDHFLALPNFPGLYAIYDKKMPIWETYSLLPRNAVFQAAELARAKAASPDMILLSDHALDQRTELKYSKTHPVLYQWIVENYRALPPSSSSTPLIVFVK